MGCHIGEQPYRSRAGGTDYTLHSGRERQTVDTNGQSGDDRRSGDPTLNDTRSEVTALVL